MRDLDSELTGLRNTLQDAISQPPADEMIKRGRRRVRRQQAQVAAVVAIIVAVGALPFLQMPESAAPANPDRSHVLAQDYYDIRSGFALGETCSPGRDCTSWFMTTSNGDTWERRVVPASDITATGKNDKVIALGTSKVVIDDRLPDNSVNRYYSNDSGRTWSSVSDRPDTTIQEIPEEAALETTSAANGGELCRDGTVIAILDDSGRSAKLANQPPIQLTWCQPYPDLNGTRWVAGSDPRTRRPVVAATRDRGRTWQVATLPEFSQPAAEKIPSTDYLQVAVVSTPAASYAAVINPGGSDLVAMFRSGDFGGTWTQTWQAADGKQPTKVLGTPVAGTDGSIWITQPGGVWASTDGATTFNDKSSPENPMRGAPRWLKAGYLALAKDPVSTGQYFLSQDGLKWYAARIPVPE